MYNYQQAIELLMNRLPMFARIGTEAIKKGLTNILALAAAMDNPHEKIKTVHVAGTNGKGSTSHLLATAFQSAGYKVGLYTSPHLVDLRERIRINGQPIPESFVIQFVSEHLLLIDSIKPSYFELNVAMAFKAFADQQVDVAIIETGMGGRLDSTNIITPELSVITNIGLDHTQVLGDTLAEIAQEKAGIIKEGVPVVIGETHPETEQVFFLQALKHNAPLQFADSLWDIVRVGQGTDYQLLKAVHKAEQEIYSFKTDLLGSYQLHNIITALAATEVLANRGWALNRKAVLQSWAAVKSTTGLRGRWDWVQHAPNIILDVAHNPAGMTYLMENMEQVSVDAPEGRLHIVCGFVKDKDVSTVLQMLPKETQYYFTQANVPRALPAAELLLMATAAGLQGQAFDRVEDAVVAAKATAKVYDTIIITGSFFVVGEALTSLENGVEIV